MARRAGPTRRLLTLDEAATYLGVSKAAIIQMLDKNRLKGPKFAGRAPKGAGRVTLGSAERMRRKRGAPRQRGPGQAPTAVDDLRAAIRRLETELQEMRAELRALQHRQASTHTGLLEMKLAADDARASARIGRASNRDLVGQIARLTEVADRAYREADLVDDVAQRYSDQLTTLLVPDDPRGVDDPQDGG
jgi:excisionase family DNA binding protein